MSSEIEDKLAQLKQKYLSSLPDKFSEVLNCWANFQGSHDGDILEEMHRLVHSLAGSGATFGQIELSKQAKTLETYIKENQQNISPADVEDHLSQLKAYIYTDETTTKTKSDNESDSTVASNIEILCIDGNTLGEQESLSILLADDDEIVREQLATILRSSDHEVFEAENGQHALELFEQKNPDLILLDVVMPQMNGYTAAEIIKKQSGSYFVPIIFLTSITDNHSLAKCIAAGGDDFLTKPAHPIIINAKIRAMQRIIKAYKKLDEYQRKTEEELETSKRVFSSLIKNRHESIGALDSWSIFPGHFSGDLQLCAKLPNGDIYALLCDFTGHGLPAALGTIIVAEQFQSLTDKMVFPEYIFREINKKMHQILPTGRYCAAILVALIKNGNELKVWNSGMPPAYLVDRQHNIVREVASSGLPLGIVGDNVTQAPTVLSPEQGYSLIFYSDGLIDSVNHDGEMFSETRFRRLIERIPESENVCDAIKRGLQSYIADTELVDDLSLTVLTFSSQASTTDEESVDTNKLCRVNNIPG